MRSEFPPCKDQSDGKVDGDEGVPFIVPAMVSLKFHRMELTLEGTVV